VLTRVEATEVDDPVLGQFLGLLARDLALAPEADLIAEVERLAVR
jgi:antitoxin PrlF